MSARTYGPCHYCPAPGASVDHIVPTTLRGSDDPSNLTFACRSCNAAKNGNWPTCMCDHCEAAKLSALNGPHGEWIRRHLTSWVEHKREQIDLAHARIARAERAVEHMLRALDLEPTRST